MCTLTLFSNILTDTRFRRGQLCIDTVNVISNMKLSKL